MSTAAEEYSSLAGTKKIDFAKPLDLTILKDKVALVTGGAAGIGLGVVEALAQAGVWVAICDVNEKVGKKVEEELLRAGCKVKFMQVDTTSWESQLAAFKSTLAWSSSRLDIVIPSAGVSGVLSRESFANLSPTEDPPKPSTLAFDVNLTGVYYTALLAIHYFNVRVVDELFKPQLCFISSLAGYGDLPFSADYSATKWGVRGIWRSLRGPKGVNSLGGIQANLIAPTFLRTAMTASFVSQLEQAGTKVGEVGDAVEGVLRAVADDEVDGEFARARVRFVSSDFLLIDLFNADGF